MPPDETPDDATVVIVPNNSAPPPPPEANAESGAEAREEIARIAGEVAAVQTRITEGLEENRTWAMTQLATLQQQLADLKATMATVPDQASQIAELRAELTRQSLLLAERQAPEPSPEAILAVDPVVASEEGTPPIAPVSDASPATPSPRKKRPVI